MKVIANSSIMVFLTFFFVSVVGGNLIDLWFIGFTIALWDLSVALLGRLIDWLWMGFENFPGNLLIDHFHDFFVFISLNFVSSLLFIPPLFLYSLHSILLLFSFTLSFSSFVSLLFSFLFCLLCFIPLFFICLSFCFSYFSLLYFFNIYFLSLIFSSHLSHFLLNIFSFFSFSQFFSYFSHSLLYDGDAWY